jgi:hypothetical protein
LQDGAITSPDTYFHKEDLPVLKELFVSHRIDEYETLSLDEKAVFWTHRFFHGDTRFTKLYFYELEKFTSVEGKCIWIWKTILWSAKMKTHMSHPFQFVIEENRSFKTMEEFCQYMLAAFETDEIQKLCGSNKKIGSDQIHQILELAIKTVKSAEHVDSFLFKKYLELTNHPRFVSACIKKRINDSGSVDWQDIDMVLKNLEDYILCSMDHFLEDYDDFKRNCFRYC